MDGYPQSRDEAENHVVRRLDSIIDLYSDFAAYAALHEKKLRTLNLINLAFLKSQILEVFDWIMDDSETSTFDHIKRDLLREFPSV